MSTPWTEALRVTIPGPPVPKGRPRFTVRGGRARTYTDPKTVQYEHRVAWTISAATRSRELAPSGTPVRVDVLAVFPRPKRLQRQKDPAGLVPHTVRPDLDNVVKAVLD
ncbi:MAG: RusA family crossover junction endodeoxyribonuclease, partial [Myxococcota bacterium]|nr:RusA family crossover junction endodeoxyribonuclease [Myxococcota bacterium]